MNTKNSEWINQLAKGTFELAILILVSKKPMYGYEITKTLQQGDVLSIADGSIYPILKRLLKYEWVDSYIEEHEGRSRKYYVITALGKSILDERFSSYQKLNSFLVYLEEGEA